jgi:hypothetical protein
LQAGELKAIAEAAVTPDEDEDNPDGHGSLLAVSIPARVGSTSLVLWPAQLFLPQDKNKELADLIRTELFPDPVAVYQEVCTSKLYLPAHLLQRLAGATPGGGGGRSLILDYIP